MRDECTNTIEPRCDAMWLRIITVFAQNKSVRCFHSIKCNSGDISHLPRPLAAAASFSLGRAHCSKNVHA